MDSEIRCIDTNSLQRKPIRRSPCPSDTSPGIMVDSDESSTNYDSSEETNLRKRSNVQKNLYPLLVEDEKGDVAELLCEDGVYYIKTSTSKVKISDKEFELLKKSIETFQKNPPKDCYSKSSTSKVKISDKEIELSIKIKETFKKNPPKETAYVWYLAIILCFLLFLFIIYSSFFSSHEKTKIQNENEIVNTLQTKFSDQLNISYKIIKASLRKVVNDSAPDPNHPSILLFISSEGAKDVGDCFAVELARLISSPEDNYFIINGFDLKEEDPGKAMMKIDDGIQRAFNDNKQVVLMKHLDMIPAPSAIILTSYCDHENAPYKKVAYIMTISTNETISKTADSKAFDSLATNHLKQAWSLLPEDQLFALLSRITVSVAAILPGKIAPNVKC